MKFANPRNDIAFKKIFGDDKKKDILISFLNAVLDFSGDREIIDVTIVNPYQVPKIEELKETILDIKAKNKNNQEFIVEMQNKDYGDFPKRSLYYTSKAYINQLDKSEKYYELKKVYFIGICNFNMFDNTNYISRHLIINQETTQNDIEDFEFAFVELPKFQKELHSLDSITDKWIYFIKQADKLDFIPEQLNTITPIHKAYEIITQYSWSKKEQDVYEYVQKKQRDEANYQYHIQRQFEEVMSRGIEQGLQKGIEQGIEQGIEKGIEQGEKNKAVEIAKVSLQNGLDIQTIATITGLTKDEIEELR
jgi:predicted transposase/invertase (TIGR01784 family)